MDLQGTGPDDWERLYADDRAIALPRGRWLGRVLGRLDTPGARALRPRLLQSPFSFLGWGIDFDRGLWTFGLPGSKDPPIAMGHFEPRVEPSRWRPSTTVGLHYEVARLPNAIKRVLYDEVRPLDESTCLGIGGENFDRGEGDHFWFVLEPIRI
jgi:hypothetical protein